MGKFPSDAGQKKASASYFETVKSGGGVEAVQLTLAGKSHLFVWKLKYKLSGHSCCQAKLFEH